MNAARTEHPHVIEIADPGELRPLEWIANASTFWAATAVFEATKARFPRAVVTMRLGARIVKRSNSPD